MTQTFPNETVMCPDCLMPSGSRCISLAMGKGAFGGSHRGRRTAAGKLEADYRKRGVKVG